MIRLALLLLAVTKVTGKNCKSVAWLLHFFLMPVKSGSVLLEVQDLSLAQLWVNLSFSIHSGEMLYITGVNGAGKTSLLKVLCGLMRPDEGRVLWQQRNIHQQAEDYRQAIAYVGHKNGIKDNLTPNENLTFAVALGHGSNIATPGKTSGITVEAALHQWGLTGIEVPCRLLSAGQCRRTALARLLLVNAPLWFLDEPTTTLDRAGQQTLRNTIVTRLNAGGAVVMATHQVPDWPMPSQVLPLDN